MGKANNKRGNPESIPLAHEGKLIAKRERQDLFLDALEKTAGYNISEAARRAGCSRRSVWTWRNEDPKFLERFNDVIESKHDFVESQLMRKIRQGDTVATIFYLKTQCKDRGYVESIRQLSHGTDDDLSKEQKDAIIKAFRTINPSGVITETVEIPAKLLEQLKSVNQEDGS
jgi:hypothetical protein